MNIERSTQKAETFLTNSKTMARKEHTAQRRFSFPPAEVFLQLCPTRERDWIDGWQCELVYTSTGYMEADCVRTTPASNIFGPGLWIVTRYEPNHTLEFVVIGESVVEHARIHLIDNTDGTATGIWKLTFTALDEAGNGIVGSIPDDNVALGYALDGLEHFLKTGRLLNNEIS